MTSITATAITHINTFCGTTSTTACTTIAIVYAAKITASWRIVPNMYNGKFPYMCQTPITIRRCCCFSHKGDCLKWTNPPIIGRIPLVAFLRIHALSINFCPFSLAKTYYLNDLFYESSRLIEKETHLSIKFSHHSSFFVILSWAVLGIATCIIASGFTTHYIRLCIPNNILSNSLYQQVPRTRSTFTQSALFKQPPEQEP